MRTWGRVKDANGYNTVWQAVTTDANGYDDGVWITTLVQCLKLNLGESPFFSQYGIPAQQSVMTQIFPDFYVSQTQAQFAQYFASLIIAKVPSTTPTYNVNIITNSGAAIALQIPV